jgi:hypothetical protein
MRMMELWESSANILLYHFKQVYQGSVPFRGDWEHRMRGIATGDAVAANFTRDITEQLSSRGSYKKPQIPISGWW